MTQNKTSKKALLTSALSLLLCCTMLIGTTWAWFTDSVTSAGNKIQSGTLKVDMLVKGGNTGIALDDDYVSVKTGTLANQPIFNYELWEPGYTLVTYVKVVNEGNLALKYTLNLVSADNIAAAKLAEVIDVYYAPSEVTGIDTRADFNAAVTAGTITKRATLKDVFAGGGALTVNDNLEPNGTGNYEDYATIVLKMQETAGNEYQDQTIPAFDICLLATQWTYEEDTFDKKYDDGLTPAVGMVMQEKDGFVVGVTDDGETVLMKSNGDVEDQPIVIPEGVTKVADYAFADKGMVSVTTPSTLKEIGAHAFESQSSAYATGKVAALTLNSGLEKIGTRAFKAQSITSVTIPNTVKEMQGAFWQCSKLTSVVFEPTSQVKDLTQAFASCQSLESIDLPESIENIGQNAFDGAGLKTLTIPKNVTNIGRYALRNCAQLTDIYLDCDTVPTIHSQALFTTDTTREVTVHVKNADVLQELLTANGMTEGVGKKLWSSEGKITLVSA